MSLTENGLQIKTFRDIVSDVQQRLDDKNSNIIITDESNKVVNNFATPIILSIAEVYELVEEVYNSFDVMSATGTSLDRLVVHKNISRIKNEYSTGQIEFFCSGQVAINTNVTALDARNRTVFCTENKTLGTGQFRSFYVNYQPATLATVAFKYYVVLAGIEYSYVAQSGDTYDDVLNNISASIDSSPNYNSTNSAGQFYVESVDYNNFGVIIEQSFDIGNFSSMVTFRASEFGSLNFPSNSITTLLTALPNITSINNPEPFELGRLEESDSELRTRFLSTSGAIGRSTLDSIIKGVSQVDGVLDVSLINNKEDSVSTEGLPPKSYETIVQGGDDQEVAKAILEYGPAGVESYGNTNLSVSDIKGNNQAISFTRPTPVYIFVKVEYAKYEEFSTFPVNGEELIKQAIVDSGSKISINQDVIPSTFVSSIYNSTSGLGEVKVTIGKSYTGAATTPISGYSEDKLKIYTREIPVFTESRIITNLVANP